jgi:hypothetical protein
MMTSNNLFRKPAGVSLLFVVKTTNYAMAHQGITFLLTLGL